MTTPAVPNDPSTTDRTLDGSGLSRRTALRAAGVGAWAVPAIVAASAAPAFAASGPPAISTLVAATRNGGRVTVRTTLVNSNSQPTTALSVQVVMRATTGGMNDSIQFTSADWAPPAHATISADGKTFTAVFTKLDPQLAGNGTSVLEFTTIPAAEPLIPPNTIPNTNGQITSTPTPTPGTATSGSGVWA